MAWLKSMSERNSPGWWPKVGLLAAGMLAMVARAPIFFLEPRFWAEEGSRNFAYAFSHGWYALFLYNFRGYFSLFDRVAALAALYLVDLEHAPLVTTLLALLVQTLPLALVLWSESRPWDTIPGKLLGMAIILLTPLTGEIWLNTINSQFYFSLATFLILLEDTDSQSRLRSGVYAFLLALAGLTGVVSCFLAPLFVLKAWRQRTRASRIQAMLLVACAMLQAICLVLFADQVTGREMAVRPLDILSVLWVKTLVLPLLGPDVAARFAQHVRGVRLLGLLEYSALSSVLLLVAVALFALLLRGRERHKAALILGAYLIVGVLSIVTAAADEVTLIDAWVGQRYFYAPSVMAMVLLLMRALTWEAPKGRWVAVLCLVVLFISLSIGLAHYRGTLIVGEDWPTWRDEVAMWRSNPDYALQIWPEGWSVRLVPKRLQ
jgi:hypothetical protein